MPKIGSQTPAVSTVKSNTAPAKAQTAKSAAPAAPANAAWGASPKLPSVNATIREVNTIAFKAKDGTLNPQMVNEKLAKMTPMPNAESDVLWSAAGASKRSELIAAYGDLAKYAPNSFTTNPVNGHKTTTRESYLQLQFTDAQAKGDPAKMKEFARQFATQFPDSPSNVWIQQMAKRG